MPELMEEWDYEHNAEIDPTTVGRGSHESVFWKCKNCGYIWPAQIYNRANATDLPLFMYETGIRQSLKEAVESAGTIASAAIITGPEGGFEPYEAELAEIMKLRICSMGPRIFRCETAPLAALSALMYATGNM